MARTKSTAGGKGVVRAVYRDNMSILPVARTSKMAIEKNVNTVAKRRHE